MRFESKPRSVFLELISLSLSLFCLLSGLASITGPLIAAQLYRVDLISQESIYGAHGFQPIVLFVGRWELTRSFALLAFLLLLRHWLFFSLFTASYGLSNTVSSGMAVSGVVSAALHLFRKTDWRTSRLPRRISPFVYVSSSPIHSRLFQKPFEIGSWVSVTMRERLCHWFVCLSTHPVHLDDDWMEHESIASVDGVQSKGQMSGKDRQEEMREQGIRGSKDLQASLTPTGPKNASYTRRAFSFCNTHLIIREPWNW